MAPSFTKRQETLDSDHRFQIYSYFYDIFNVRLLLLVHVLVILDAAAVADVAPDADVIMVRGCNGVTICQKYQYLRNLWS